MKSHPISISLTSIAMLLSMSLTFAAESKTDVSQKVSSNPGKNMTANKTKASTNIKQVNINGATREELKKLPGIGEAEADKIIAGRPYASKANLVTHNIIANGVYENIKKLIIAKQPYKDGAKNAAIYSKKK